MPRWLDRVHDWLAPRTAACPFCGGERRRTTDGFIPVRHPAPRRILQELCSGCLARIPWIVHTACPICGRPERCGDCLRRKERYFERCRGAVRYDDAMKERLALYKYRGLERLEPIMAAMLAEAVEKLLQQACAPFDLVTSVPLAEGRLEERGFNQAERLALRIADWYGMPYRPMLRRVRNTAKQSLKGRQARILDMRGNFEALDKGGGDGRPQRILLIDDIYTTGSTMNECAYALRSPDPSRTVCGALWARS